MRKAIYVHPWDIFEEGASHVLETMKNMNLNSMNIATVYHAGRFLLPHNILRKVVSAEEGVAYFNYDQEYFNKTNLKPVRNKKYKDRDVLKEIQEANESYGIELTSWTVLFHNEALSTSHPEVAVVDPFGFPDINNICPNSSDSRNYASGIIQNMIDSYGIKTFQLESMFFPGGLIHGNHHEVFGVNVTETMDFLFSICYCKVCLSMAKQKGYNLEGAIPVIRSYIKESVTDFSKVNQLKLQSKEDIIRSELKKIDVEYLIDLKDEMCKEVVESIIDSISVSASRVDIEVISNVQRPFESFHMNKIPEGIKAIDLLVYFNDPMVLRKKLRESLEMLRGDVDLYPSIRINYPVIQNEVQLYEILNTLKEFKLKGFNLYNYGWTPMEILNKTGRYISNW